VGGRWREQEKDEGGEIQEIVGEGDKEVKLERGIVRGRGGEIGRHIRGVEREICDPGGYWCNTLFPPVCKNNYTGQELWQTQKCECVM
jgi:hypothetical protein